MLNIIYILLMALGISFSPGSPNHNILVINQDTGESYGIGTTAGTGLGIVSGNNILPVEIYYLMRDQNGNYFLVRR